MMFGAFALRPFARVAGAPIRRLLAWSGLQVSLDYCGPNAIP